MRQMWGDYHVFWREFRRASRDTGAVLPSGRALSAALVRYVHAAADNEAAPTANHAAGAPQFPTKRILEVGAGTGAVTSRIVRAMRPTDRLVLVECNERFVSRLRVRLADDPYAVRAANRIALVHTVLEKLEDEEHFDVIISGLPLNNFEAESVKRIMTKIKRLLAPGGTLSFFEYVGIRRAKSLISFPTERKRLKGVGRVLNSVLEAAEIRRDLVWANVPPAWVHHVRFAPAIDRSPVASNPLKAPTG